MSDQQDVVYGTGDGRELRADIFAAKGGHDYRTAVLQLHGGRWRYGSRKMMAEHARRLSNFGFTCVPTEYRLLNEAPWPAALYDVKAAVRWVRANAQRLGVEPNRIVIQGCSAGGYLALIAAGTNGRPEWEGQGGHAGVSSAVNALVSIYPVTLFKKDWQGCYEGDAPVAAPDDYLPASLLLENRLSEDNIAAISPYTYATPDFPPTALWHGGADAYVPPSNSLRMYEALAKVGAFVDLHIVAGVAHAFDFAPSQLDTVQQASALFFRRAVSEPGEIRAEAARAGETLRANAAAFNLPR